MLKVFVDASVILELLLGRSRSDDIVAFFAQQPLQLVISPLTIHLAYYFGLKAGVRASDIKVALVSFTILNMDARSVVLAQERLKGRDFEDCLQAAAADQFRCDLIITLDKGFAKSSGATTRVLVL